VKDMWPWLLCLAVFIALGLKCESDCRKRECPQGLTARWSRDLGCVCVTKAAGEP
jgi:hypothetical protein